MAWTVLGKAFLIFMLRITDVSMGTVRTMMIIRGQRRWAALIGFVEVTIWVLAIGQVIANLDTIWNIVGYSGGFAVGTLLGMWIENKLALSYAHMSIVSMKKGCEITEIVRKAGHGVTQLRGEGHSGPVSMLTVVVARKQIAEIIRAVNSIDATAFITVEDTRQVVRGYSRLAK